jgi:hypothetical protein
VGSSIVKWGAVAKLEERVHTSKVFDWIGEKPPLCDGTVVQCVQVFKSLSHARQPDCDLWTVEGVIEGLQ